jgi:DNA processing protein
MQTLTRDDPLYPQAFRGYRKAPQMLYCEGDTTLLKMPAVAIIGTRTPTECGLAIASAIARYFAKAGYVIVSGLAQGVDAVVHEIALSVEGGNCSHGNAIIPDLSTREHRTC